METQLQQLGCACVMLEDDQDTPVFEPDLGTTPLWDRVRLSAFVAADGDIQALLAALQAWFVQQGWPWAEPVCQRLEDQDWANAWQAHYQPFAVGQRLWICPSWCEPPQPQAICLQLDPGLAFGTGSHPTTLLCLHWLEQANLQHKRVLDFGCGSGILGLSALLLGADHLSAIDIDPQALTATNNNAQLNAIAAERLGTGLPDSLPAEAQFDVIVANILAGPLIELSKRLLSYLAPNGQLVLSGLLSQQIDAVITAYTPIITFDPPVLQDGWVRLSGQRSQ